jgi:hypothetical protein
MKFKLSFLSIVVLVCAALMLASCSCPTVGIGSGRKNGPPPHAPAHGYRHKHHGIEIIFDSEWGIYVVVGFPGHYYYKGHYYRFHEAHWEMGIHIDGPWKAVSVKSLPPGLRNKGKDIAKSKGHPGLGRGVQKKK